MISVSLDINCFEITSEWLTSSEEKLSNLKIYNENVINLQKFKETEKLVAYVKNLLHWYDIDRMLILVVY